MKTRSLLAAGAAAVALTGGMAHAQGKDVLAIVVKGLDNPFFEQINLGCQKWQAEHPDAAYECLYTGPASSADEAGQVQVVEDLLNRGDVKAIAISPSNAPAMGNMLRRVAPQIPIMTIDADLVEKGMKFARELAAGPTLAHGATKRLVRAYLDGGVAAADATVPEIAGPLFDSEDLKNAVESFLADGPGKATFEGK